MLSNPPKRRGATKQNPIRILLADDHALVMEGLAAILSLDGFEVVGQARSGRLAVELFTRLRPDLALLEVRLAEVNGIECVRTILRQFPEARLALLSSSHRPEDRSAGLQAGARAFMVKDINRTELVRCLTAIHNSTDASVAAVPRASKPTGLTPREQEILTLVARGQPNKLIASELLVTEGTIKLHLHNMYQKLGVSSRTEAMRVALERGLVSLSTAQ